jgi:catecholate siderophore receptor
MKKRRKTAAKSPRPQTPTSRAERTGNTSSPSWALVGVLAVAAAGAAFPSAAVAQSGTAPANKTDARQQTRRFAIAAGSLDSVLAAFSRTTGISVTDPGAVAAGTQSAGVSGNLTAEEALYRILSSTGLTYTFTNVRALRIEKGVLPEPGVASRQAMLDAVTVSGTRTPEPSSTKYTEPLRDIPQTVTVISHEVIEAQGATSLRDVIKNVPGITINAGEGGAPPGDNFNVRGFSARSDLFVDGVRDIGGYSRDAFNLEQVEVAEGPASAYTGRGSTGGSINLVTKAPHLGAARSVTVTGGSASQGRGTADVNQPLDELGLSGSALRLNAMWSDGHVAGNDDLHNKSWGIAPSLAFGLGSPTQVQLSYTRSGQNNLPAYGLSTFDSVPHVDTRHFFGLSSLDFEHVSADEASARIDHQHGSVHLRNQLTRGHSETGRIVTTAAATTGARSSKTHVSDDEILTNQTSLTTAIVSGAVSQDIAAGVELSGEKSSFGHYTITGTPPAVTDFDHPDPALNYHPTVALTPDPRRVTANSVGAYLFDTFKFGRHVEVNGGGRWDHFDPTFVDSVSHAVPSASMFSGRLGVVIKPSEAGSIYAAYGTSFNPSIQNLSYDGLTTLPPEENRSVEVGTKWSVFKERVLATVALFRTDKTNARTPDPDDPSVNILAGKQRVQGAEISATGAVTPRWSVLAGYSYLESRVLASGTVDQVGTELVNTPKHSANLWTTYQLPGEFELGAGARYVDRRFLRGTTYVPGYRSYDAVASKSFGHRVGLRLNVYNLTDALYYDNGRFWVPAPGRSAALSTTIKF